MSNSKSLSSTQQVELLQTLKTRFEKNPNRHKEIEWQPIHDKLEANVEKLWSINEMEITGGEPDVVAYNEASEVYMFFDCSAESPKERRSLCYDEQALDARKENKPKGSAHGMAKLMGIEILNEAEYRTLQQLGKFDTKTSSWIATPENIRKLGGALFADFRFDTVFVYHNGVQSYYSGRAFRGKLLV